MTLARAVRYRSAGTVEFVYDSDAQRFYFLEVNTRLQVEHGVTEQVWGVDLVRWMIELAAGTLPRWSNSRRGCGPRTRHPGAAVRRRPRTRFPAQSGPAERGGLPAADGRALRIDTWVEAGCEIPPYFDPMIAKVIACAPTRDAARDALDAALAQNPSLRRGDQSRLSAPDPGGCALSSGSPWTRCLETLAYRSTALDVLSSGTLTTVQDWPGRQGYWAVGVPPSGPMDDRALRLGNRLLGNAEGAAGLEITMSGPRLRFARPRWWRSPARGCRSCSMAPSSPWTRPCSCPLARRSRLALSRARASEATSPAAACNCRITWAARAPSPWASSAVTAAGRCGRRCPAPADARRRLGRRQLAADVARPCPRAPDPRDLRPHGAPEYFTAGYIETFFAAQWEVHFNSSRTGVRLIGPRRMGPDSGGEAGLHPSNIHDNPYAVGPWISRGHAGDPGTRWSEPGRFCVPGDGHRGGPVAARPASRRATACSSLRWICPRPAAWPMRATRKARR